MEFKEFLDYTFDIYGYQLKVIHIITAAFILIGSRLFISLLNRVILQRFFKRRGTDIGRQYAVEQILKYFIYTIAIISALQVVGIRPSVLLGSAAALLVGIGLGLQQTFNDLISGLILLSEGTAEVGDIVELNGEMGVIKEIGIRTSKIETRNDVSIIVPNSKLVGDMVVNWSHNEHPSRFHVDIGVGYSSDVDLVTQLLLDVAQEHTDILNKPAPRVIFVNFGDSSLDFKLFFFSKAYLKVPLIQSDLRYAILKKFRANGVEIPFPQRDIWIKQNGV